MVSLVPFYSPIMRLQSSRNKLPIWAAILVMMGCSWVVGCGDEETPVEALGGEPILTVEAADAEGCEYGGSVWTYGIDRSGDGEIDAHQESITVCDGEIGAGGDEGGVGPVGPDGQGGAPGQDSPCAETEPIDLQVTLEEANYHRVNQPYTLTIKSDASSLQPQIFGDVVVGQLQQIDDGLSVEVEFETAQSSQIMVVATDGCHLDSALVDVDVYPPPYVKLDGSAFYTCGLRADGTITCWGLEQDPDLSGEQIDMGPLVREVPQGDDFVDLSVGAGAACGHHANGAVTCWMAQQDGQSFLVSPHGWFERIFGGGAICGLRSPEVAYCLEADEEGTFEAGDLFPDKVDPYFQVMGLYIPGFFTDATYGVLLGDGEAYFVQAFADSPQPEPILEGEIFSQVDLDTGGFCGINADEYLMCELITVDVEEESHIALDFQSSQAGAVAVNVGFAHGCAVFDDGTIECIGEVYDGGLLGIDVDADGLGETVFDIPQGVHFVDVATGMMHACGLTEDQEVICWGEVKVGELELSEVTTPIQ